MSGPLTVGELLAVYGIVSASRSPRAKVLAERVREVYMAMPRTEDDEGRTT